MANDKIEIYRNNAQWLLEQVQMHSHSAVKELCDRLAEPPVTAQSEGLDLKSLTDELLFLSMMAHRGVEQLLNTINYDEDDGNRDARKIDSIIASLRAPAQGVVLRLDDDTAESVWDCLSQTAEHCEDNPSYCETITRVADEIKRQKNL